FEGFDFENSEFSHFTPFTDEISNAFSFTIDDAVGSANFTPGTINSGFHILNTNIEAETFALKKMCHDNMQNLVSESSEPEAENQVNRRRQPARKGLLNIGKRKL